MSETEMQPSEFESVRDRLAEIAEAVEDESLPLDEALDLYEEAVALGLQASDLLETGVIPPEEEVEEESEEGAGEDSEEAGEGGDAPSAAESQPGQDSDQI